MTTYENIDGTRREVAREYEESYEEVDPDRLSETLFRHNTVDLDYFTKRGHKVVRATNATAPVSERDDYYEGEWVAFYDDGKRYVFDLDDHTLKTVNRESFDMTVAESDDFYEFRKVRYPESAVIDGAIQGDVQATIYYRTSRSPAIQSVTINVDRIEGGGTRWRINGEEVRGERSIEANSGFEREIRTRYGRNSQVLGKTCRVEFPVGHRYVVDIENLPDESAEKAAETIEKNLKTRWFYTGTNRSVKFDVGHVGRIER